MQSYYKRGINAVSDRNLALQIPLEEKNQQLRICSVVQSKFRITFSNTIDLQVPEK